MQVIANRGIRTAILSALAPFWVCKLKELLITAINFYTNYSGADITVRRSLPWACNNRCSLKVWSHPWWIYLVQFYWKWNLFCYFQNNLLFNCLLMKQFVPSPFPLFPFPKFKHTPFRLEVFECKFFVVGIIGMIKHY